MKFRKKPLVVEAVQWFPDVGIFHCGVYCDLDGSDQGRPYVVTIHGERAHLAPGDWILPEPDGRSFYPVKPEIFSATYESAQADDAVGQPTDHPICPRAHEASDLSSSAGVAARPALARPADELNVDELLGALDVLYRASHEHALEGHPWQRPNQARTVIDVWLRASSLEHVKEVLYGGVMEAAARIAGPAPSALARPAWQPIETAPERETVLVRWRDGGREKSSRAAYWPAGSLAMDDDVPEECVTEEGTNVTGGWFEDSDVRDPAYWPLGIEPTHWQALPPPPTENL